MKWSECSYPNLLASKSEVDSLRIQDWIHGVKNILFLTYKVLQGLLWNSSHSLNCVISQFFFQLCQMSHELQTLRLVDTWWMLLQPWYCPLHIAGLGMVGIMAACVSFNSLSPFPFFLWRGISSLGSHIKFVHSSAYPRGNGTLFLWHGGWCQTQSFLWTLIP